MKVATKGSRSIRMLVNALLNILEGNMDVKWVKKRREGETKDD